MIKKGALAILISASAVAIAFWLAPSTLSLQQNESDQSDDVSQTSTTVEDEEPSTESSIGEREVDLAQDRFNAALDEISPAAYDNYSNHYSTYIELVLGDIGKVDVDSVLAGDVDSISELLRNRADVTGMVPGVELEIIEIRSNQNDHTAIYRQRIHGIQFDRTNKVQFDTSGTVKRLSSKLIDPSKIDTQPTVLEPEAVAHAKIQLAADLGMYVDDITVMGEQATREQVTSPTLYFGINSDDELYPYWRIALHSEKQELLRLVTVDAQTGQSKLLNTMQHFKKRICERGIVQSKDEPGCHSPDAEIIFTEGASGVRDCDPGAPPGACGLDRNRNPWNVLDRVDGTLDSNTQGACCSGVGGPDNTVDVVSDDIFINNSIGGPGYSVLDDAILLPQPHEVPHPPFKEDHDFSKDDEAIAHEAGHAVTCGLNVELCVDSATNIDITAGAISEASADMVAVIYCEKYGCDNEDWKITEGSAENPNDPEIRDISKSQNFPNSEPPDSQTEDLKHAHSTIYSHAYYKLHTEKGVSMVDITRIVIDVVTNINRDGGDDSNEFDPEDFKEALRQAASAISTSMRSKVDAVIDEMTPPAPPASIAWGNNGFVYCHQPACALWDMRGIGGAGASSFKIKRSFSYSGTYTTIQTVSSINYFNVHGSDKNMYWKICGINSGGQTCSPAYRTRIECETGGGGGGGLLLGSGPTSAAIGSASNR